MKRRRSARRGLPVSWPAILLYGGLLAAGVLILQWIEYQQYARTHSDEIRIALLAALFLGVGVWVGAQLFRNPGPPDPPADGNPKAQAALGISDRERDVLVLLAQGLSNKEIARELGVSPNTVKTHVARLYEKLEAGRRTQAVQKARDLGLVR
ncbi:winged helix-turn-helix transcriptional regulator [Henriciella mobilis]|uniref:helix-turn-helix transcriptional regulator n=1 Tax=Henriciella mobilis TaxID=2305467 RepID=UPI000E66B37A|nr:response regulator transcription factor [Henriciella mobilis]RIJ18259.1 winged helix-turn-helix transcriptional regulator [Henriciella mobilis]RIJ24935.1 winged helix-turn-helix transcriptional regulator [Henriciella mobilis]